MSFNAPGPPLEAPMTPTEAERERERLQRRTDELENELRALRGDPTIEQESEARQLERLQRQGDQLRSESDGAAMMASAGRKAERFHAFLRSIGLTGDEPNVGELQDFAMAFVQSTSPIVQARMIELPIVVNGGEYAAETSTIADAVDALKALPAGVVSPLVAVLTNWAQTSDGLTYLR